MEENKIYEAHDLLMRKKSYKRAIEMANDAIGWDQLIIAFQRADKSDFLGGIESVKAEFIKSIQNDIAQIEKEIAYL